MSLLDVGKMGSSLSLRSFPRFGSSLSIFGSVIFGSRLSVLDYTSLGSSLSVETIMTSIIKRHPLDPTEVQSYIKFDDDHNIEMYAIGNRGLTVKETGGVLHGAWSADGTVTTSDRRLKKNIEPLYRTLAQHADKAAQGAKPKEAPVGWLLRELRPVSFNLKHGPEAKYLKFGFIAQELETVFPNLIRTAEDNNSKAVASQDLIALLTLALQTLQKDFDDARRELEEQSSRLSRLEAAVFAQNQQVHV